MKSLAQCYTASERWAWPSHLAVRSRSPTPCCLSGDGYLPGRTWVWLGVVGAVGPCLAAAYTVSWGCFEAASSALAPQKASSPVGVGFMMWFPSSCLWRSALLPRVRKPMGGWECASALESVVPTLCSGWVMPVSPCSNSKPVVLWGHERCSLVWNQRSHPCHPIAHESTDNLWCQSSPISFFLLHWM